MMKRTKRRSAKCEVRSEKCQVQSEVEAAGVVRLSRESAVTLRLPTLHLALITSHFALAFTDFAFPAHRLQTTRSLT